MSGWILGLDASTPRCVLVLGRGSTLEAWDEAVDPPNQTSARLLQRLRQLTASAGIEPSAIEAVGCGRGPGTFTGTRVAVATAKGIAFGLGVPVIGVSTLSAVAFSAEEDGLVLPLLDARRGEVYGGLFEVSAGRLTPRGEERCAKLSTFVEDIDVIPVGSGVAPYADQLPEAWRRRAKPMPGPSAVGLWCALAVGEREPAAALQASYLRKSYAELGVNKPKRPMKRSPFL